MLAASAFTQHSWAVGGIVNEGGGGVFSFAQGMVQQDDKTQLGPSPSNFGDLRYFDCLGHLAQARAGSPFHRFDIKLTYYLSLTCSGAAC